jgi:amino acid permease
MFTKNVGSVDSAIRFAIGTGILFLGYYNGSYWGLVGVIPILTAIVGFCPAYLPFGLRTCSRQ